MQLSEESNLDLFNKQLEKFNQEIEDLHQEQAEASQRLASYDLDCLLDLISNSAFGEEIDYDDENIVDTSDNTLIEVSFYNQEPPVTLPLGALEAYLEIEGLLRAEGNLHRKMTKFLDGIDLDLIDRAIIEELKYNAKEFEDDYENTRDKLVIGC